LLNGYRLPSASQPSNPIFLLKKEGGSSNQRKHNTTQRFGLLRRRIFRVSLQRTISAFGCVSFFDLPQKLLFAKLGFGAQVAGALANASNSYERGEYVIESSNGAVIIIE